MADEKMVEKELLADGWLSPHDGKSYHKGDIIKLSEEHAEVLESHGSVGKKGTVEKADDETAELEEREARTQRVMTGLEPVETPKRGPGRPRSTKPAGE